MTGIGTSMNPFIRLVILSITILKWRPATDSTETHRSIGVPIVPLVVQMSVLFLIWKDILLTSGHRINNIPIAMVGAFMQDPTGEFITIKIKQVAYPHHPLLLSYGDFWSTSP